MTVEIYSEAAAPLPTAGNVTLFVNSDKNFMLYEKFPDGTLRVVSNCSGSSTDLAKAWMDAIKCGLLNGQVSADEFQTIMDQGITIQSDSTVDSDGGLHSTLSVGSRIIPLNGFTVDSLAVGVSVASPTHQIVPAFDPVYVSNKGVTYVSSDPTKATVSDAGLITRVANGSTNISVVPQADPSKTKVVVVTVTS